MTSENRRPTPPFGRGFEKPRNTLTLDKLHGMAEARAWGEKLARDLAAYRKGQLPWKDVDPACLLHGPPGTGKTTFATALANTCGVKLISTSFSVWQGSGEGHLGTTLAAMAEAFTTAIESSPCIFFIDELDSVPKRGGNSSQAHYMNQVTNAVLKEFDRFKVVEGVVIVAACNHPDMLDPALVRSGRMDRMIGLSLPTCQEIEGIIRFHLRPDEVQAFESGRTLNPFSQVALLCSGMSGADVEKTVREARSRARDAREVLHPAHFVAVIDPPEKRLSEEAQARAAVHEAGHALAAVRLAISTTVSSSSTKRTGCGTSTRHRDRNGRRS